MSDLSPQTACAVIVKRVDECTRAKTIEMYFLKGSRQTNRFGANPLRPAARNTKPRWEQNSEIEMVPHKAGPYVRR